MKSKAEIERKTEGGNEFIIVKPMIPTEYKILTAVLTGWVVLDMIAILKILLIGRF